MLPLHPHENRHLPVHHRRGSPPVLRRSYERAALSLVEKSVARLTGFFQSHRRLFCLRRRRCSEAATILARHPANALVGTVGWVSRRGGRVCRAEASRRGRHGHLHRAQRQRCDHYVHRH